MAVGCIGLILGLKTPNSLFEASHEDCGSVLDANGNRIVSNPRLEITVNDLRNTILTRTRYNEWVVRGFDVLGVLAISPFTIKVNIEINDPTSVDGKTVTNEMLNEECSSILNTFDGYKVYTFNATGICKLTCNSENHSVEHSEIYKS
jgi:hypothetical protein